GEVRRGVAGVAVEEGGVVGWGHADDARVGSGRAEVEASGRVRSMAGGARAVEDVRLDRVPRGGEGRGAATSSAARVAAVAVDQVAVVTSLPATGVDHAVTAGRRDGDHVAPAAMAGDASLEERAVGARAHAKREHARATAPEP